MSAQTPTAKEELRKASVSEINKMGVKEIRSLVLSLKSALPATEDDDVITVSVMKDLLRTEVQEKLDKMTVEINALTTLVQSHAEKTEACQNENQLLRNEIIKLHEMNEKKEWDKRRANLIFRGIAEKDEAADKKSAENVVEVLLGDPGKNAI